MIMFVHTPPAIEPQDSGFLLTFESGDTKEQLFLSLHAMTGLCGKGALCIREAQARAAMFEPTPISPKRAKR